MKIFLSSYGLKGGMNPHPKHGVDFYVDCRQVCEPPSGSPSGDDKETQAFIEQRTNFKPIMECIIQALERIPSRRGEMKDPYSKPFHIAFFCAWGVHRSRAAKHIVGERLKAYLKDRHEVIIQ